MDNLEKDLKSMNNLEEDFKKFLTIKNNLLKEGHTMNEEYVSVSIAPYCLANLLLALHNSNIKRITITQEDNELVVRIPVKHLNDIVYNIKEPSCKCGIKEGVNNEKD